MKQTLHGITSEGDSRGDKGLIGIALTIFKCADSSLLEEKLTVLLHRNDFSFCSFEMYYTLTEIESDLF